MSKAGTTYLNRYPARAKNAKARNAAGKTRTSVTRWMALAVVAGTMSVLCFAVNIRAFVEMNRQALENRKLNTEIQQINSMNVVLQEEIENLKGDPKTIEREARKIGMSRPNERILVPMN